MQSTTLWMPCRYCGAAGSETGNVPGSNHVNERMAIGLRVDITAYWAQLNPTLNPPGGRRNLAAAGWRCGGQVCVC